VTQKITIFHTLPEFDASFGGVIGMMFGTEKLEWYRPSGEKV